MTSTIAVWRSPMPAKARAFNDHWACPKCNTDNSCAGIGRPPDTISATCHRCLIKVDVFVPLEKDRPYNADGIMEDQIYAVLENTPYWNFQCPACLKKNRGHETKADREAPVYRMGLEKKKYEIIVPCQHCGRNILIKGEV